MKLNDRLYRLKPHVHKNKEKLLFYENIKSELEEIKKELSEGIYICFYGNLRITFFHYSKSLKNVSYIKLIQKSWKAFGLVNNKT